LRRILHGHGQHEKNCNQRHRCQERKNRDNENVHNALLFPPSASGRKWVLGSLNPYRSKRSMNDGMTPVATNSPTTLPFSTPLCSNLKIVCVVMVLRSEEHTSELQSR